MGNIDHDKVHETFSKYDCFLFPTLSENYGHVIAESLASGTPVITSDQTPWNSIVENGAGWSVSLTDSEKFDSCIKNIIDCDQGNEIELRKNSVDFFYKNSNLNTIKSSYYRAFSNLS